MRVMRVIYEHRGGTCDNALSFVLRAVSTDTGLIPNSKMRIPFVYGFRILETLDDGCCRSLIVRVQRGVPNHLTTTHPLGPPRIASTGSYDTSWCSIRSSGRRNPPPAYRQRDENASQDVRASVIPETLLNFPKPIHRFSERIPYRRS